MKILISGYTGFIGQHLLETLCANHEVYGLSRNAGLRAGLKHSYTWDQLEEIPSVEWCIHLSGLAHDMSHSYSDHTYLDVNFELTRKLTQALRNKCEHFMYFSSIKALCESGGRNLKEEDANNPKTAYGLSKQMAEDYLLAHGPDLEMHMYILRPVMIYGADSKGNIRTLVQLAKRGMPYPFPAVENEKSILYIKNLCHVVEHFVEHKVRTGIYHVADPGKVSTYQLFCMVSDALHKKVRSWQIPAFLYKRYLRYRQHGPAIGRMLHKLLGDLSVDSSKLQEALKENPMPYTSEEGIRDWLR